MAELTRDCLKERLHYDPETGVFRWLPRSGDEWYVRSWNTKYAGRRAGSLHKTKGGKYYKIRINKQGYLSHRLAFLYMTGSFPAEVIDHKDGDGLNNKWNNLRSASQSQNLANKHRNPRNSTGFKGVARHVSGRYYARLQINGETKCLGYFDCPVDAHEAYRRAAKKYFGEFAWLG